MDDFLHDTEADCPVASEGSFWNSQDDTKLWYHYWNGDIDPHNNNMEYLLQKTQQYFPTKSQKWETAICILRDKNKCCKLELSVTCSHWNCGKWLIAVFCFCVRCLNNKDTEDLYKDNEEAIAAVPVTAMRRSSSLKYGSTVHILAMVQERWACFFDR